MAVAALSVATLAWWLTRTVGPVMAHLHNVIAVLFILAWPAPVRRSRPLGWHRIPLALFTLATLAALGGANDPLAERVGEIATSDGLGTPLALHEAVLAPAWLDAPALTLRLVLFFAFAQSVHYAVWLRAVPEEDRARPTPRTFRASLEALRD